MTTNATSLKALRHIAIARSLFDATTLGGAIDRLGFIQADPIRAPARAQDLILRHRVVDYLAGDLERQYPTLGIEEDVLYAYGFMTRDNWRLVHPRTLRPMSKLEQQVLDAVREAGVVHPKELEPRFGRELVTNAWGGRSAATTAALDGLHYRGLLRVARRDKGIRVYEVMPHSFEELPGTERARRLALATAKILAPVSERALVEAISPLRRLLDGEPRRAVVRDLVARGELEHLAVDGITYLVPAAEGHDVEVDDAVRLLAPFDPVVWDRRRFEHLWGWPYRFEAYTPVAKRVRGYYALPLLWRDNVIGWGNVSVVNGEMNVDVGFVEKRPRDRTFTRELDAEVERMRMFLAAG